MINPRLNPEYKKLCAMLETTKRRPSPKQRLHPEILRIETDDWVKVYLVIRNGSGLRLASTRCDLKDGMDGAAKRVARKLTLDGGLPRGMNEGLDTST